MDEMALSQEDGLYSYHFTIVKCLPSVVRCQCSVAISYALSNNNNNSPIADPAHLYDYLSATRHDSNDLVIWAGVPLTNLVVLLIAEFVRRRRPTHTEPELVYLQRPFVRLCSTHLCYVVNERVAYVHGIAVLTYTLARLYENERLYDRALLLRLHRAVVGTLSNGRTTSVFDDVVDWRQTRCMPRRNELPPGSSSADYTNEYVERVQHLLRVALATENNDCDVWPRKSGFARVAAHWYILLAKTATPAAFNINNNNNLLAQSVLNALDCEAPVVRDSDRLLSDFLDATRHLTALDYAPMGRYWRRWYSPACKYTSMPLCQFLVAVYQMVAQMAKDGKRRTLTVSTITQCCHRNMHRALDSNNRTESEEATATLTTLEALVDFICFIAAETQALNTPLADKTPTMLHALADIIEDNRQLYAVARAKLAPITQWRQQLLQWLQERTDTFYASKIKTDIGVMLRERPILPPTVTRHLASHYALTLLETAYVPPTDLTKTCK